jgi:hypothetical protein
MFRRIETQSSLVGLYRECRPLSLGAARQASTRWGRRPLLNHAHL